jgi:hypothetical protein
MNETLLKLNQKIKEKDCNYIYLIYYHLHCQCGFVDVKWEVDTFVLIVHFSIISGNLAV